jgi:hypothetical protein
VTYVCTNTLTGIAAGGLQGPTAFTTADCGGAATLPPFASCYLGAATQQDCTGGTTTMNNALCVNPNGTLGDWQYTPAPGCNGGNKCSCTISCTYLCP